jgi:Co/Zn/Cd efflux system component
MLVHVSSLALASVFDDDSALAPTCLRLCACSAGSPARPGSGLVILWQFRHRLPESREQQALRLIALSFFALAAYVAQDSVRALLAQAEPDASPVGIALAATSLCVMPFLSRVQRRTGRALHSSAVVADSAQTLLCTYLSAVLLVGLLLNATLGWGWADPLAGLVIALIALKEGRDAWRGESCCGPVPSASAGEAGDCC